MTYNLMDYDIIKQIATRAAYRAGKVVNAHFGRSLEITKKGEIDLVTQADIASEQLIISTIRDTFPDHTVLAEESGMVPHDLESVWIIDPLDGTTNFAHGFGMFAISIAFAHKDEIIMGLVFNPQNGEFFSAIKGQGAFLNDQPIRVSASGQVSDSLLATGFPYDIKDTIGTNIQRLTQCLTASRGIRRLGSAALDLCYVACGRFDGFWEENLNPWDVAAGFRIVEEAGGQVSDYSGGAYTPAYRPSEHAKRDEILATNGLIHREMIDLIQI
jgi:myo-inositol-1(or 4)-monophosphatase